MKDLLADSTSGVEKHSILLSVLIYIYYILDLYLRTTNSQPLFLIWTSIGYVGVLYVILKKEIKIKYILLLNVLMFSMMLSSLFMGNMQLLGIFFNIQYLGIAFIISESKLNVKVMTILVYSNLFFFLYQILIGTDPNHVFFASRNHISTVLLNVLAIYYITSYRNKGNLNILPALLALIISIWSVSRSGMVSISLFFIGLIIMKLFQKQPLFKEKQTKKKINNIFSKTFVLLLIIAVIVYIFRNFYIIQSMLDSVNNNFKLLRFRIKYESYISFSRIDIIKSYLHEMSINLKNCVFGVKLSTTHSFLDFSNNLHNSYLTAHMYFGLLGFLGIIIMICFTVISYLKQKKWLYLLLFVTVLVRVSTDIIAFPGYMDSVIYFFILDALNRTSAHSKKKKKDIIELAQVNLEVN
ncbi:MAG: hypothetical protein PHY47_21265 [Lachnospiraceae bacterium]|nr:hypothetical protein [Lachnospiraceae bacterium]